MVPKAIQMEEQLLVELKLKENGHVLKHLNIMSKKMKEKTDAFTYLHHVGYEFCLQLSPIT